MMPILATTYGESVTCRERRIHLRLKTMVNFIDYLLNYLKSTVSTWTPYLLSVEPTGPILKGITYMVRPGEER